MPLASTVLASAIAMVIKSSEGAVGVAVGADLLEDEVACSLSSSVG